MAKIFFITHTYSLEGGGGGEVFVSNLLRGLAKKHEIFVFTTEGRHYPSQEKELGIKIHRTPVWGHHGLHKYEMQLHAGKAAKLAKEFGTEIVHAHNDVLSGFIAQKVKEKTGAPLLLNVEYISGQAASLNMKLVFLLNKWFLRKLKSDITVCWSRHVMEKYLIPWKFKKKEIEIIPAAVDTAKFSPEAGKGNFNEKYGQRLIVSAKPLHKTNSDGIEVTIRAMKTVLEKFPEYKYIVFGHGTEKERLQQLAKSLGLQGKVVFPGQLDYNEVPKAYNAAVLVVHSFAFEATTSIALLESMACARPVVVTSTGEIARAVGNTVLTCRPNNPEEMAQKVIYALEHRQEMELKGETAREKVLREFSVENAVAKFDRIYGMLA